MPLTMTQEREDEMRNAAGQWPALMQGNFSALLAELDATREALEHAYIALGCPTSFMVATLFDVPVRVGRCTGNPRRLPRQLMWAVRWMGSILQKDGNWTTEPPSGYHRAEFYDATRFETFDAAALAAETAVKKGVPGAK